MRGISLMVAVLILPCVGATGRENRGNSQAASSITEVARTLTEEAKAHTLPACLKGRVKLKIDDGGTVFPLPSGPSPAVLFSLPEYSEPYTLTVTSFPRGFGTWKVFVPTVVLLDSALQPTREVPEADLTFKGQTFSKSQRLEVEIPIDASSRDDRYLLMYTDGSTIGELYGVHRNRPYGKPLSVLRVDVKLERSLHGSVEVEARPVELRSKQTSRQ